MKNPRFIIGSLIILALAAFGFAEWRSVQQLEQQLAALRQESEARAAETASARDELEKLRQQLADGKAVIAQLEARGKEVAAGNAGGQTGADAAGGEGADEKKPGGDFGKMVQKMFSDPKMKGVMRSTQMMAVKSMYADLAKELGLSPEQANQVIELIGERQMAMTSKGMKMLGGESADAATLEEVGKEAQAANEEYDAQLENILGKDGMTKLKEYERTAGDRMQIQQYKQAFDSSGVPLDEKQSQGLLGIMKEERLKQPPSPLDPGAKDVGAAMQAIQSDETFNALMSKQEDLNSRVLRRSGKVLSPDQMVQFEQIQKQQMETQKIMMDMGRQFMKAK